MDKAQELLNKVFKYLDILPENLQQDVVQNSLYFTQKNPDTFGFVFDFLKNCLKTKGKVGFKNSIVQVMEKLLHSFPQHTEQIMKYLVLYIEDSFDEKITLSVLEIFTNHFQKCQNLSYFFKYLINRLVLDTDRVRVATITALGQNSLVNEEIKAQTTPLFESLLMDINEEVSGRVQEYLSLFQEKKPLQKEVEFSGETLDKYLHQFETNFTQQDYSLSFIDFNKLYEK